MRANQLFQPAETPAEKIIRTYFYNTLFNYITQNGTDFNYTRESLPALVKRGIAKLMSGILDHSYGIDGIRLPEFNVLLTREKCPPRYLALFQQLMSLKYQEHSPDKLQAVAEAIMSLPTFLELNPTQQLLEMAGLASPIAARGRDIHAPVTSEDIRETFYNLMFAQTEIAVKNGWLAIEKIQGFQHRVWTALPALTILAALQEARNQNGIPLMCGKIVTHENCPQEENFPAFVAAILSIKDKFQMLCEEELHVVRHKLCCKHDVPEHLQRFDTPDLMQFMAVVNGMATTISQSKVFQKMTPEVFTSCCEMLEVEIQSGSLKLGKK